MSEQIKKIVQVDDPIMDNLLETDNKLNELNQEVVAIVDEYQEVHKPEFSFFNFNNPFFLLTLVGLFMLTFALWFLQQELKYLKPGKAKKKKSAKHSKPEIKTLPKLEEKVVQKSSSKNIRKIKVLKIK